MCGPRTGPHISENIKYASAAKTFYEDTNSHKAKPKYVLTVKFHVLSAQEFQFIYIWIFVKSSIFCHGN